MTKLTTTERLALPRLGTNPESGTSCKAFAETINLSIRSTRGILNSLAAKGYVGHTPACKNRRYWRIRDYGDGTTQITPGQTLDDSIANLRARASQADQLQEALHQIANILAENGITIFKLEKENS